MGESLFETLCRAKTLGWNFTTLLVHSYLEAHGPTPVGRIAEACQLSVRSVERAMAALKGQSYSSTNLSHDHAQSSWIPIGTAPVVADTPVVEDPLVAALIEYGVLPWCVEQLLARVERAVIERQLAYHAHRLAVGFPFKSHPARYLFRACLNDYQAPDGYFAQAHREREALPPPEAPSPAVPAPPEQAPMTREGALSAVRLGRRSRLPAMQAEARRLAQEWGIPWEPTG